MKQQLQKMIYAFIITAMMFFASANAQIVYIDVIPDDTILSSSIYYLDLNNDGMNDFHFQTSHYTTGGACIPTGSPSNWGARARAYADSNSFVAFTSGYPAVLNSGNLIDSSLIWGTTPTELRYIYGACITTQPLIGNWSDSSSHYLALKVDQSGNNYYGWIRIKVQLGDGLYDYLRNYRIIIQDYAYNSIPNQPILAGQITATGIIENSFASSVHLFPNPATNNLSIAFGNNNKKVDVTITDITGTIIYTTTAIEIQKIEVNTEDFKKGIYVVQIKTAGFIVTKRLVVEK